MLVDLLARAPRDARCELRCLRRRQFGEQDLQHARHFHVARGRRRRRACDDDHDFAARHVGVVRDPLHQFVERPAVSRLEFLGDFPCNRRTAPATEDLRHVGQRLAQPMRRLVEDQRPRLVRERLQRASPRRRFRRQESFEREPVGRQRRQRQRGDGRAWTGHGHDGHACSRSFAHQHRPRIAQERRSRIAHQRHGCARAQALDHARGALALVLLVQGFHAAGRPLDPARIQELRGVTRILGEQQVGGGEHLACPRPEVAEVADRRRHQEQCARLQARYRIRDHFRHADLQWVACCTPAFAAGKFEPS